jgi:hypothetical protein
MSKILKTIGKYTVETIVDDDLFEELNKRVWYGTERGYVLCKIDNKSVFLHHLIIGKHKGKVVDHINGDKLDNRKQNLRIITQQQNLMNRRMNAKNESGYKGVRINHDISWSARICKNRHIKVLGYFPTKEEAARAYNKAAIELFGEYAYLNEVD